MITHWQCCFHSGTHRWLFFNVSGSSPSTCVYYFYINQSKLKEQRRGHCNSKEPHKTFCEVEFSTRWFVMDFGIFRQMACQN